MASIHRTTSKGEPRWRLKWRDSATDRSGVDLICGASPRADARQD